MSERLKQICIKTCKSKITIIAAILVVLYTLVGFFLLPFLIERYLPGMLGKSLNYEVSLKQVKINPFTMTRPDNQYCHPGH